MLHLEEDLRFFPMTSISKIILLKMNCMSLWSGDQNA